MRRVCVVFGLLALLVAAAISSSAQATSTLSGTVRDESGAVVPGAAITIKNQLSGDERKTVSTGEGVFSVPALHAGTYTVKASAQGFADYSATDVVLTSNDAKSINVVLPLKTVTETITVSAERSAIVTEDSGAKGQTIDAVDIQNMVLGSRNATEIVKLMAGASLSSNNGLNKPGTISVVGINTYVTGGTASGMGGTNMNGQKLDITMDGSHTFDPGAPGANSTVNPNIDMISEVKVLASSFSAENENGPVVINVATKGGGSQYHGQAHFYAQNAALNSTEANDKINHLKKLDGAHQYYPGGSFGGPIPIPGSYNKNHDKLFFWDGFESYRQLLDGGVARAVVPTDAMLNGDFSAAATAGLKNVGQLVTRPNFDPNAAYAQWYRNNVPGWNCQINAGVLSSGCINPWGQALMRNFYPKPNADPTTHDGFNYITQTLAPDNSWQNSARVDWSISDNTKVFVRYSAQREGNYQPMGVWAGTSGDQVVPIPGGGAVGNYSSDNFVASLTHVFSPTMTSETTFSWQHAGMPNSPVDASKVGRQEMGIPLTIFGNDSIPGMGSWGGPNFPEIRAGGVWTGDPLMLHATKMSPSAKEQITKVYGAHTFKAGAFWEYIQNKQDPCCGFGGYIVLPPSNWGNSTGNNFADLLMGVIPNGYSESQATPPIGMYSQQMRFYVTDHWKINRRLTVDVGLRFDHFSRPAPANDLGMAIFDPSRYNNDPSQLDAHSGLLWHGVDSSIPLSGVKSRFLFYSPRFGLAWDVFGTGKTVVRGGYGKFRAYDRVVGDNYDPSAALPYGAGSISCDNTLSATTGCPTWQSVYSVLGQYSSHTLPGPLPTGTRLSVSAINPRNDEQPLVTTYNLQIDQKLPGKFMLEVAYVGNYGDFNQYQQDVNAIPLGAVSQAELFACTQSTASGGSCPSWSNIRRPMGNYQSVNTTMLAGKSQYDGLQVSLHRSVGFVSLMANYTWSKSYGNTVVGNGGAFSSLPDNGRSEYWGVSREDRPHTLNLTYTVNVPKVQTSNRLLSGIGNGWQISGITSINSGTNLIASGGNNLNYGWDDLWTWKADPNNPNNQVHDQLVAMHSALYYFGADSLTLFPTIVCNPMIPGGKKVTLPDGSVGMQYLKPECFKPTESGMGSSHMPYLGGPIYWNSDLGITKHFRVTEKQSLEFKFQAFNFLNHALWSFTRSDAHLQLQYDGNGVLKNQNTTPFGVATTKYGHRTIQLEARYTF